MRDIIYGYFLVLLFYYQTHYTTFEGKYCYADGKRYEGEFKLGKFNG